MSRKWFRPPYAWLGLLLGLTGLGTAGCPTNEPAGPGPDLSAADTTLVTVDNSISHQIFAGFGGTTRPLVYPTGDYLGIYRGAAIAAAYRDVGISLGMLALGTQETPANATDRYAQRANDNADPFVMAPAGFNFADSDILLQKIIQPARPYGFNDLSLGNFISHTGSTSWLLPIRGANYSLYLDESAEYVLTIMRHWRDAYGLTPPLLHIFNEPSLELQSPSVQEIVDLVKRIGDRLRAAGFASVKFIVPNEETISKSLTVAQAILADPAARQYVGVIGYHAYPYGSAYASPRRILEASGSGTPDPAARQGMEQLKALGQQYNVPVWLTEVSEGPGFYDYAFGAIEHVLARAIHIHDNFAFAGATAYFGMLVLWDSQTDAEHVAGRDRATFPFLADQTSMVLVDVGTGRIYTTGMGYAVGHYARWIKPGVRRIAATSDHPRVIVSAFRDPATMRIVVVAVNNEHVSQLLRVSLSGAQARGPVTGETSYAQVRWEAVPGFSAGGGGVIEFVAQPLSVVTLAIPY